MKVHEMEYNKEFTSSQMLYILAKCLPRQANLLAALLVFSGLQFLLIALLFVLWATGLQSANILDFLRNIYSSGPATVALAVGISPLGIGLAIWRMQRSLQQWLHGQIVFGWLPK